MILARFVSILVGYCFGLLLSGYFIGKLHHQDIRTKGSGNVGSTNTLRVFGVKAGFVTLFMDILKAVIPAMICCFIFRQVSVDAGHLALLYGSFGAVLGHDFPVYLHFKGGKGVATTVGMILVAFPETFPGCAIVFFLTVLISRYVSLGSILSAVIFMFQAMLFDSFGWLRYSESTNADAMVIVLLAGLIVILKHRSNIIRLYNDEENRFTFHPNTSEEDADENVEKESESA